MKKNLFLLSVAMLALTACNNDAVLEKNTSSTQQKEIAFEAIATPATRAAVNVATMPTSYTLKVAAYDATAGANYFEGTSFTYSNSQWTGGRYWPFTTAVINFLAYTHFDNITSGGFCTNDYADFACLTMADNSTLQNDLMYAAGQGSVTGGNSYAYPENVPMTFKHAQAWIQFTIKAGTAASIGKITVDSITLNQVACSGIFEANYQNYNVAETPSVVGSWSDYSGTNIGVVRSGSTSLTASAVEFGNLLVVPEQGTTGFTIHYTLDGNQYDYVYTLNPESTGALVGGTKYVYNISLSVHEIVVAPTVAEWGSAGTDVTI
jgi:hypothetical protein